MAAGRSLAIAEMISLSMRGAPACLKPGELINIERVAGTTGALTSRYRPKNLELRFLGIGDTPVAKPADHGIEQNDESQSQSGDEEPHLLPIRLPLRHGVAKPAEEVQGKQRGKPESSIELRLPQVLERIDQYHVSGLAGVDAGDAHHSRNLADSNAERSACHERRDGDEGDEFNYPTGADQADEQEDHARNESQASGYFLSRDSRVFVLDLQDNVADNG